MQRRILCYRDNKLVWTVDCILSNERFEDWEGIGVETIKYRYTLILESKTKTRHYVNRDGILEYEENK